MKKSAQLVASMMLLASPVLMAHSDHDHDAPRGYDFVRVNDNLLMLAGIGGNVAVLKGEQGLLLVDGGYQNKTAELHAALANYGGEAQVAYVINTHWHGDHTEGNLTLGQVAPIIAHENVRKRLSKPNQVEFFGMKSDAYPEPALPSLTYAESMTVHFNGEQLDLVHYPKGHTDSDTVVFFRNANVVHMGDHFFNGFFPFVDTASGGNVVNMANNIEAVLALIDDDTVVIPGHGSLSNKAELSAYYTMLRGTVAEVKAMKAKAYSLEKMQKKGFSKRWDSWAKGFVSPAAWVAFIDTSL